MPHFRLSSVGCTPKDSIGAPPVEGLYDARSLEPISNSPFAREQVRVRESSSFMIKLKPLAKHIFIKFNKKLFYI